MKRYDYCIRDGTLLEHEFGDYVNVNEYLRLREDAELIDAARVRQCAELTRELKQERMEKLRVSAELFTANTEIEELRGKIKSLLAALRA